MINQTVVVDTGNACRGVVLGKHAIYTKTSSVRSHARRSQHAGIIFVRDDNNVHYYCTRTPPPRWKNDVWLERNSYDNRGRHEEPINPL